MAKQCPSETHAGTSFLKSLIDQQATLPARTPYTGYIGVCLGGGSIKHIGLLAAADRMDSKWGRRSPPNSASKTTKTG